MMFWPKRRLKSRWREIWLEMVVAKDRDQRLYDDMAGVASPAIIQGLVGSKNQCLMSIVLISFNLFE